MTQQSYKIEAETELKQLAKTLLSFAGNCKIFILEGNLGAGKTTFVKAIAQELNCTEAITSPTYSIVNEYITKNDTNIFHFDLYRLNSIEEIEDIGFWEYFSDNNYIFIEWADLVLNELGSYVRINIRTLADESREFTFSHISE